MWFLLFGCFLVHWRIFGVEKRFLYVWKKKKIWKINVLWNYNVVSMFTFRVVFFFPVYACWHKHLSSLSLPPTHTHLHSLSTHLRRPLYVFHSVCENEWSRRKSLIQWFICTDVQILLLSGMREWRKCKNAGLRHVTKWMWTMRNLVLTEYHRSSWMVYFFFFFHFTASKSWKVEVEDFHQNQKK